MQKSEPQTDAAILAQRYHIAWLELTNRIGFRQQLQQGYIIVGMAIFGAYFSSGDGMRERMGPFLLIAISAVTLFSCMTIHFHNLAIQKIAVFLAKTEANLKVLGSCSSLYYFWDGKDRVAEQHGELRTWSRWATVILFASFIFGGHILYYTTLPEEARDSNLMWPTGIVSFGSLVFVFWGFKGDRQSFKKEGIRPSIDNRAEQSPAEESSTEESPAEQGAAGQLPLAASPGSSPVISIPPPASTSAPASGSASA